MAVKIHSSLQYHDVNDDKPRRGVLDMDLVRASVTRQSSGQVFGIGWEEGATGMGLSESMARRRVRVLSLSSREESPVNSIYPAAWFDVTNDKLSYVTEFETQAPPGCLPVFLASFSVCNARYAHGNTKRASNWGKRGGQGNKRNANHYGTIAPSSSPFAERTDPSSGYC